MIHNLTTFTNSTIAIDESKIEQAILVSTLTKKPVHVEGDWFVWTNQVLPKRLLLGVILSMTYGNVNSMAANKVSIHYEKVKNQIPKKYRAGEATHTGNQLLTTLAGLVLNSITPQQVDQLDHTLNPGIMQKLITEIFGQEYESQ